MRRTLCRVFMILVLLGGLRSAGAGENPPTLRWPLDLPTRYLTSNFMEYRPGRYHAGLDLKTQSRTGFPIHAAQKGCIVRLRATARAYGRAVYLQTPSGKTYVYAHLSRFSDRLRAKVRQAQAVSGTYRTELYFQPGELCVEQGDVLGLTGQSGTAGPHLHFEVRNGRQEPLNPLDQGFAVLDTFPPVIYSIHAVPMTPEATIAGHAGIMMIGDPDHSALPDTLPPLSIQGAVAFSARIVDHNDIRGYRLEPWLLSVTLDGEEVYRAENSTFAFGSGSRERLEWYDGFSPRERWLFKRTGVDIPGREGQPWPLGAEGDGLSPGEHVVVVTAQDFAGGTTTVVLPLVVGPRGVWGESTWRPDRVLALPGTASDDSLAVCLNPFFSTGFTDQGFVEIPLSPQRGDPVLCDVSLWARRWRVPGPALIQALAQHLEPTAWAGEYQAGDWPMESSVPVKIPPSVGAHPRLTVSQRTAARVYRWNGQRWSGPQPVIPAAHEPSSIDTLSFALTRPGLYAVFLDETAPVLKLPHGSGSPLIIGPGPSSDLPGVTAPRWEVFPIGIVEDGSGVASGRIVANLDGTTLVLEPDLPRQRLLVELPDTTQPGLHKLEVMVEDQCGNLGKIMISIECRLAEE